MASQNKKNRKPLYVGITLIAIVIITAAIIYFLVTKKKDPAYGEGLNMDGSGSGTSSPAIPSYTPPPTSSGSSGSTSSGVKSVGNYAILKEGDKAQEVRWVQYLFNTKIAGPYNITPLAEDYVFGSKTKAVVNKVLGKPTTTYAEWKNKLDSVFGSDSSLGAAATRAVILAKLKS